MTEKLWHAVGALSDDILAGSDEANVRRVFRARKKRHITVFSTLAACVCLSIIAGLCLLPVIMGGYGSADKGDSGGNDMMAPNSAGEPTVLLPLGATAESRWGHLTFLSFAGGQATFLLENTEDGSARRAVTLYGTPDGRETAYDAASGTFTVTVDGTPSPDGTLPAARGTYRIIIAIGGSQAESGTLTDIQIDGFGRFALPGA